MTPTAIIYWVPPLVVIRRMTVQSPHLFTVASRHDARASLRLWHNCRRHVRVWLSHQTAEVLAASLLLFAFRFTVFLEFFKPDLIPVIRFIRQKAHRCRAVPKVLWKTQAALDKSKFIPKPGFWQVFWEDGTDAIFGLTLGGPRITLIL